MSELVGKNTGQSHDCDNDDCEDDFFCSRGLDGAWKTVSYHFDSRCTCGEIEAIEIWWVKTKPPCTCDLNGAQDINCQNHKTCVYCEGCKCEKDDDICQLCAIDKDEAPEKTARRDHLEGLCDPCEHFVDEHARWNHDNDDCVQNGQTCRCFDRYKSTQESLHTKMSNYVDDLARWYHENEDCAQNGQTCRCLARYKN
jgi:hypothetical protein